VLIVAHEYVVVYRLKGRHYPASSKLLHWLVAICVLTTAPVAIAMTRVGEGPTQDVLYNFHKSLGILIFILMTLRLINRLAVGAIRESSPGRRPSPRRCIRRFMCC
jgi:cytochrome b561